MDQNTVTVIVISIFALIILMAFIRYRRRGGAEVKGPFGITVKVEGDNNEPPPRAGISAKGITSRQGGVLAEETTGQGIEAENIDARDNIILSNSNRNIPPNQQPPSTLNAQTLNAGGDITIQQFIGEQGSLAQQLQFFARQIGLQNTSVNTFASAQFESYCDAWKSLQSLRLIGNDLWNKANSENILKFANQLRQTEILVSEGEIFFEDRDRLHLLQVLRAFGEFRIGKERLIDIRSTRRIEYWEEEATFQIRRNHKIKMEYDQLLEDVRISFNKKLSNS